MGSGDVIYTIGILLAVLIVLIVARSIVIRRAQRAAAAQLILPYNTRDALHAGRPNHWNWESANVARPEAAVTRPDRTVAGGDTESVAEQLPRYEAPPPEYDAVIKSQQRNPADGHDADPERVEMRHLDPAETEGSQYGTEQGEGSTAAATIATSNAPDAPPYARHHPQPEPSRIQSPAGDAVVNMPSTNSPEITTSDTPGIGQRVGRAWGRLLGRQ